MKTTEYIKSLSENAELQIPAAVMDYLQNSQMRTPYAISEAEDEDGEIHTFDLFLKRDEGKLTGMCDDIYIDPHYIPGKLRWEKTYL